MPKITMMGNGDKETGQNTIIAPIFAEMFRFLLGVDVAVLQRGDYSDTSTEETWVKPEKIGWNFDLHPTTSGSAVEVTIDKGLAMIYGYLVYADTTYTLNKIQAPSSGTKYVWVYLRVDLSNANVAECTLDILDKGSDSGWWTDAENDNLISNPNGKYILPLYRFQVSTTGVVSDVMGVYEINKQRGKFIPIRSLVERSWLSWLSDECKEARTIKNHVNSNNAVEFYVGNNVVRIDT